MNTFSFYILGVVEGDTNDLTFKIESYEKFKGYFLQTYVRVIINDILPGIDVQNQIFVIEC